MCTKDINQLPKELLELINRVQQGEDVILTRDGQPIARLTPTDSQRPPDTRNTQATIDAIKEFRKGQHLGASSIREMINTGRQ